MEISTAAYRPLIVAPPTELPAACGILFFFLSLGNDDFLLSQHLSQLANAKDSRSVIPEWAEMRRACILRQLGRCADHPPVLSPSRCGSEAAPWSRPLRRGLAGALRTTYHPPSWSIGSFVLMSTFQTPKDGHSPSHTPGENHGASPLRRRRRSARTRTTTPPLTPCRSPNSCAP